MVEVLVFSDMDGTLLNHDDYRFDEALPALHALEQKSIPVIFNTSKTRAELMDHIRLLDNHHPFIVENGAAILIPSGYFASTCLPEGLSIGGDEEGYQALVLGRQIAELQEYLKQVSPSAINFSSCSLEQAIGLTGLRPEQAKAAQTRQYSVPLFFEQETEESAFARQAQADGFGVLRGGRFLHLVGRCDKGQAMLTLKRIYDSCQNNQHRIIALGDSPNDEAMLERADVAIVVRSPSSNRTRLSTHHHIIKTRQSAPQGWAEGIEQALGYLDSPGLKKLVINEE